MSKCEQCIVREFSSLKALNKEELLHLSDCKESYTIKKGEVIFEEGDTINGIYCIKDGVCKMSKLSANGKDHILFTSAPFITTKRITVSDKELGR